MTTINLDKKALFHISLIAIAADTSVARTSVSAKRRLSVAVASFPAKIYKLHQYFYKYRFDKFFNL